MRVAGISLIGLAVCAATAVALAQDKGDPFDARFRAAWSPFAHEDTFDARFRAVDRPESVAQTIGLTAEALLSAAARTNPLAGGRPARDPS